MYRKSLVCYVTLFHSQLNKILSKEQILPLLAERAKQTLKSFKSTFLNNISPGAFLADLQVRLSSGSNSAILIEIQREFNALEERARQTKDLIVHVGEVGKELAQSEKVYEEIRSFGDALDELAQEESTRMVIVSESGIGETSSCKRIVMDLIPPIATL